MVNGELNDEVSDTTDGDSSTKAGNQVKRIIKKNMTTTEKRIHPDSYRDLILLQ